MLRKKNRAAIAAGLLVALATTHNYAQDSTETKKTFSISGSVDGYYRFDFGKGTTNSLTSFTQTHNSFSPGMASLKFEHRVGKVGAVADLGFGPRAREFSYTDEGLTQAVKQLYITYSPASWITLAAGTWSTHVGYELLDPQLNRNYSMSYMFTSGPFSHTGMKATLSTEAHALMLGIANPTDYRIPPKGMVNRKFFLAQYSFIASDKVSLYLNLVTGKSPDTSNTTQLDAVISAKINDNLSLGFNGTVARINPWDGAKNAEGKTWWGSAFYFNYDPIESFGLTLRSEFFSDRDRLRAFGPAVEGGTIFSNTLSANFRRSGFILIPELRIDRASNKALFSNSEGDPVSVTGSFLIAVVYSF